MEKMINRFFGSTIWNCTKPFMFICGFMAMMTFSIGVEAKALKGSKPNIIVIMPDDIGYGDIASLGNPVVQTPNIDSLKRESLLFTQYHVSPRCSPSRAVLMGGRHEFMSGVTHTQHGRERLSLDTVTLPQGLKSAGYTTGHFGKWHIGREEPYRPENRGFDESYGIEGGGTPKLSPTIFHNGVRQKKKGGYATDLFFEKAFAWIDEQRKEDAPFFVYIAPNDPHGPYTGHHSVPSDDYKKYLGKHPDITEDIAKVYWMVENIDRHVGTLLSKLEEWQIAENTLLIYIGSDNGNSTGWRVYNAGMKGHKGQPYQGGTRVPVFFRWPTGNIPADAECSALTSQMDMMPTLLEITGAPLTDKIKQQVEGRSLVPMLKNPEADWEDDRHLVHHVGAWEHGQAAKSKHARVAIQNKRFTLVNNEELYDLKNDPGETTNVIDEYPEVVARLRAIYDKWWTKVQPRLVNEDAKQQPADDPYFSWKSLFDGKTFEGWEQLVGNPKLKIGNDKYDFICYDKELKNFDLGFKFKVNFADTDFDFGVFFRSQIDSEVQTAKGYNLDLSSVAGSQSKVDLFFNDSEVTLTSGVSAKISSKQWNDIRVVCAGGRVQAWLNNHKIADLFDGEIASHPKGKIAFYIESKFADCVSLKDLQIRELQQPLIADDEWDHLLDKELTRWDVAIFAPRDEHTDDFTFPISKDDEDALAAWEYAYKNNKSFEIGSDLTREFSTYIDENSELILKLDGRVKGFLATSKPYKNYHFQAYHRWPRDKSKGGKGGIFYHAKDLRNKGNPPNLEYQHAYGNYGSLIPLMGYSSNMRSLDPRNKDGSAIITEKQKRFYRVDYDPRGKRLGLKPVLDNKGKILHKGYGFRSFNTENKHGEWNLVEYYCYEDETIHLVNGHVVCAGEDMLDEEGKALTQGLILLESEWAGGAYKEVKVRPIKGFPEVYKHEVGF
jgi:arylsulfatase